MQRSRAVRCSPGASCNQSGRRLRDAGTTDSTNVEQDQLDGPPQYSRAWYRYPQNDLSELRAIRQALGSDADSVIASSTKAVLGHLINAAAVSSWPSLPWLSAMVMPHLLCIWIILNRPQHRLLARVWRGHAARSSVEDFAGLWWSPGGRGPQPSAHWRTASAAPGSQRTRANCASRAHSVIAIHSSRSIDYCHALSPCSCGCRARCNSVINCSTSSGERWPSCLWWQALSGWAISCSN